MLPFSQETPVSQYIQGFHGDLDLILSELDKHGLDLNDYLPPEFKSFSDDIKQLRGNQLKNLIGSILACAGSLFAFSMNSAIAAQCTSLPVLLRTTIACSPLLAGGFLRIYSAYEADQGRGKENILQLLGLSILGMLGNIIILRFMIKNEDLSTITTENCWPLIVCGVFIGLGLGTYASGMTLGARTASNDSVKLWENNLRMISTMLSSSARTIHIQPSFISNCLWWVLRQRSATYSAIIAGIANASPSIPITVNAYAETLGLPNSTRIALFAGIQLLTMLGIYTLLNNPVYDQLLKNNPRLTEDQAKKIAIYTGQSLFASGLTFSDEIKQLTQGDMEELWSAVVIYSASYGVLTALITTGGMTLRARCVPALDASLTIARAVAVSSVFRAIPLINSWFTATQLNQGSLFIMSTALGIFALVDKKNIPESMLYTYAIFCGVVCFAVVSRLVDKAPDKVGLMTGASSGVGAFAGFPLSLMMTWLQQYNPIEGTCSNGTPHAIQSFQLFVPMVISVITLLYLSTSCKPCISLSRNRYSTFQPAQISEASEETCINDNERRKYGTIETMI